MYMRTALPPAREPSASDVDNLASIVLDADCPEVDRINAVHRLRGERDRRREISRRLVRALNEPLLWFGSELHWALAKMDDSLALGVDAHGMIAASPEADDVLARDDEGQRHCPTLGPVHAVAHAGALFASLASPPPWLRAPPDGGALVSVGGLRRVWLQHFGTIGGRDDATVRITEIGSMLFEFRFVRGVFLVRGNNDEVSLGVGDTFDTVMGGPLQVIARVPGPDDVVDGLPLARTAWRREVLKIGEANGLAGEARIDGTRTTGHAVYLGGKRVGIVAYPAAAHLPCDAYIVDGVNVLDVVDPPPAPTTT